MDSLTTRNFKSLSEGMKHERKRIDDLTQALTQANEQIGQLRGEIAAMRRQIAVVMAKSIGTGATKT